MLLVSEVHCIFIRNDKRLIENAEENQNQFKPNPKNKSKGQLNTIKNVKNLYESRQEVIELYINYAKIVSETKYRGKHGTGFDIIIPKQISQRLQQALAQVKAGNYSESSLN